MEISVTGKLLVCFFLLLAHGRIFFTKHESTNSLSFLAFISLVVSLLDFFAQGASVFSILLVILSFFSFLSNIKSITSTCASLIIDRHSSVFVIFSFLEIICVLAIAVGIFLFAPIKFPAEKFSVTENTMKFSGSFRSGFVPPKLFERPTTFITFYEQKELAASQTSEGLPVVIVLGDKRGDLRTYAPYMFFLAELGHQVVFADFYASESNYLSFALNTKLLRQFAMRIKFFKDKTSVQKLAEKYNYLATEELKVVVKFAREKFGADKKIFLVGDEMTTLTCSDFATHNKYDLAGYFLLTDDGEYKTKGYGFIEETDPLAAKYFFGLEKSKTFALPQKLAQKTDEQIMSLLENQAENFDAGENQ